MTVLPIYLFWKNVLRQGHGLEAVLRYEYAVSGGANWPQVQHRYDQEVVLGGRGNAYHAVYVGFNHLIFGYRLKLMNEMEYSLMKHSALGHHSFDGWTFLTGVRVYF